MDSKKSIGLLEEQTREAELVKSEPLSSPKFKKWKRDTEIVIEKVFGSNTRHLNDFKKIHYSLSAFTTYTTEREFHQAYVNGINNAIEIIYSMIQEIEKFGLGEEETDVDAIKIIKNLCNRFHLVARQLRHRHSERTTIEIEDEYDTQDLFHGLLHINFDDIREEEWTPSYAGSSSRVDFLLKKEKIVIELKKTRKNLSTKEIGEQLIIDSKKYKSHPDCKCLLCFIYDPEGRIGNPRGFEDDLNEDKDGFKVIVIIK